jgi:hypothetical protein
VGAIPTALLRLLPADFGININPDSIYSDGMLQALRRSACKGVKLVLYPGVRFELEGVVAELRRRGYLDDTTAIAVPPRVAAGIAVRNPHPFTLACRWDDDCLFEYPVYHYLVDRSNSVMVLHTISMGPIMLDYAAISGHLDETFDTWTLDATTPIPISAILTSSPGSALGRPAWPSVPRPLPRSVLFSIVCAATVGRISSEPPRPGFGFWLMHDGCSESAADRVGAVRRLMGCGRSPRPRLPTTARP